MVVDSMIYVLYVSLDEQGRSFEFSQYSEQLLSISHHLPHVTRARNLSTFTGERHDGHRESESHL